MVGVWKGQGVEHYHVLHVTFVSLLIVSARMYQKAFNYHEFNSVECMKGVLRLHPTGRELAESRFKSEMNASSSPLLQDQRQSQDQGRTWLNTANAVGLFFVLVDYVQLAALVNFPEVFPEQSQTYVLQLFILEIEVEYTQYYEIEYWICCLAVLVWLFMCLLLLHAMAMETFFILDSIPRYGDIVHVLSNVLFLIITKVLLSWLSCSEQGETGVFKLDKFQGLNQSITCWTDDGIHARSIDRSIFLSIYRSHCL